MVSRRANGVSVVLLYQHEQHFPLGKGIKPLLRAA